MPIAINGSGTVTGISVGGLPDGIVDGDTLASGVGGKILQVKQALKTDVFSTSSTSFTDITGLSVDITPSASSSKILVSFDVAVGHDAATQHTVQLVRQVSSSDTIINPVAYNQGTTLQYNSYSNDAAELGWDREKLTYQCIDSPATTAAVNYRLRTYIYSASKIQYINRCHNSSNATGTSTLIVMEVAA